MQRGDIKYATAMVVLDILAPILLMLGLKYSPTSSASLLNNFEIVATTIIAIMFFGEIISKRLWLGHYVDHTFKHITNT
ncbi:MAG: EamA family transporter [Paludibacteraceae bacterium]|nr:EamA family transporter [Paludibacteraceae bacterium]